MATSLESLPEELIELVVRSLELHSICSLRATSRSTAAKASQGHFKTYFRSKTISLTVKSLKAVKRILQPNGLGCLLETATIAGVIPSSAAEQDQAEPNAITHLLFQAFAALKNGSNDGRLRSLRLDVIEEVDNKGDAHAPKRREAWEPRFEVGTSAFRATMLALQESELSLERLDLFGSVKRCSIAFDQIGAIRHPGRLAASMKHVKQLALSLSHTLITGDSKEAVARSSAVVKLDIAAISRFLELMPFLEDLDLHWFNLRNFTRTNVDKQEQISFDSCYTSIPSTALKVCVLRGLHTTENALLDFLRQTSATRITLQEIHLHLGTFRPILDTLTSHDGNFEYLHLDDLFESEKSDRLIYFKQTGLPKFPSRGEAVGPSEVIREGEDVRQALEYAFGRGRPLGSPEARRWNLARATMFGPPERIL